MKKVMVVLGLMLGTAGAHGAIVGQESEEIPDKWKMCSLITGCPDVSTRLCGEFEDFIETEIGGVMVTYRCYDYP
jgi:hypothetical protein